MDRVRALLEAEASGTAKRSAAAARIRIGAALWKEASVALFRQENLETIQKLPEICENLQFAVQMS